MKLTNFLKNTLGKKSVRDSGAVLIDQGLMSLGTFIVGVLVARSVSKEDYGIFVLGWSLIFVIQGIQRGLVVLPFTIFCPRMSAPESNRYLGSGLVHSLVIGLLALLVFSVTATLQNGGEQNNSPNLIQALPLLSLVILPFLLREQMRSAAIARLDFLGSAKVNIIASVLMLAVTFYLYLENGLTLSSAYMVIATASLLSGALLIFRQWDSILIAPKSFWPDFVFSLRIGKWMMLNVIAYTITSQIYPWLLLLFLDGKAVAAYGASLAVAGALYPLLRGVNAYALPRMAHGYLGDNKKTLKRMLWKTAGLLAIPFGLWTILGSIFADPIMGFLYADKYIGHGILVSLLIIKTLIESVSTPFTSALQAIERPDMNSASLIIGAIISISLGIFLTKEFGLIGAGITAVVSSLIIAICKYWLLTKLVK